MQIAKDDKIVPRPAKLQGKNPLNSVELMVDLVFASEEYQKDEKGAVNIHEKDIFKAL